MIFPTLGQRESDGSRGIFIADNHADPIHIRSLTREFNKLAPMIGTLFIEMFWHNQANIEILDAVYIGHLMKERNFTHSSSIGPDLHGLIAEANRRRINVCGVDYGISETFMPKRPSYARKIMWRTSDELNSLWVSKIHSVMSNHRNKHFAIFAGEHHGTFLRRNGLPNLACFKYNGNRFEDITHTP